MHKYLLSKRYIGRYVTGTSRKERDATDENSTHFNAIIRVKFMFQNFDKPNMKKSKDSDRSTYKNQEI